jgi:hypothetical protein
MNNKLPTLIMKDELILVTKRMAWNKALHNVLGMFWEVIRDDYLKWSKHHQYGEGYFPRASQKVLSPLDIRQ